MRVLFAVLILASFPAGAAEFNAFDLHDLCLAPDKRACAEAIRLSLRKQGWKDRLPSSDTGAPGGSKGIACPPTYDDELLAQLFNRRWPRTVRDLDQAVARAFDAEPQACKLGSAI